MKLERITCFILLFISTKPKLNFSQSWRCTEDFCSELTLLNSCPNLSEDCKNATKSIVIPSLSPCNCCDTCIIFQDENNDCIIGSPGQSLPNTMCGPGLECSPDTKKCVKMSDSSKNDPEFFPGYTCDFETDICNCAITDGENTTQIFGEFEKAENTGNEKQCECSIAAHKAKNQINKLFPFDEIYQPTARCLPNGQFNPLQCTDTVCVCVDKETGLWNQNISPVPIVLLKEKSPECFDPSIHKPGTYYTECEIERNALLQEKSSAQLEGAHLIYGEKINCNPDGTYVNLVS